MAAASFTQPTQEEIQANLEAFRTFYESIKENGYLNGLHHEVTKSITTIIDSEFSPLSEDEVQLLTPTLVMDTFMKHAELGLRLPVAPDDAMDVGMRSIDPRVQVNDEEFFELALMPTSVRILNYLPALFATIFDEWSVFGFNERARAGMYYACGVALALAWNSGRILFDEDDLRKNSQEMLQALQVTSQTSLVHTCRTGRTCWGFVEECNARGIPYVGAMFMEWARGRSPLDAVFEKDRQFATGVSNPEFRQNLFRQIMVFYFEFARPSRLLNINAPFPVLNNVAETYYNSADKDPAIGLIMSAATDTQQGELLDAFETFWGTV